MNRTLRTPLRFRCILGLPYINEFRIFSLAHHFPSTVHPHSSILGNAPLPPMQHSLSEHQKISSTNSYVMCDQISFPMSMFPPKTGLNHISRICARVPGARSWAGGFKRGPEMRSLGIRWVYVLCYLFLESRIWDVEWDDE